MDQKRVNQTTITISLQNDYVARWAEAFLIDRKAKNLSAFTIKYYRVELTQFLIYCDNQVITLIEQLTPDVIRRYLLFLEERGRNSGGLHSGYRAIRAFLLWYEEETEPEGWSNPVRKVKAPKNPYQPQPAVELETIRAMLKTCTGGSLTSVRDRALILFLLDTGARAAEVCSISIDDFEHITGSVLIRQGKGRKSRMVPLGQKARRALRAYLKQRPEIGSALWVTDDGERLSYWGLNEIIKRRAKAAGVEKPGLHDFRRAFALNYLRNGGDIYSLQKIMGHADLQVLRRYLAQTDQDLIEAHRKSSPVDHMDL
jgi:site-specific recombinase XerD